MVKNPLSNRTNLANPNPRVDFTKLNPDDYDTDKVKDLISKKFVDKVIGVYNKCQFIVNKLTDFEHMFTSNDLDSIYIGNQLAECIMGLAIIDVAETNENPYDYSWFDFHCQRSKTDTSTPSEKECNPHSGWWCNRYSDTMYQVAQDWIASHESEYNQICAWVVPLKLTLYFYWEIIQIWSGGEYDDLKENIKINKSNIMNSFDKKWEQKMNALHENNDRTKNYLGRRGMYTETRGRKIDEAYGGGNINADITSFCNKIAGSGSDGRIVIFMDESGSVFGKLGLRSYKDFYAFLQNVADIIDQTGAASLIDIIGFSEVIDDNSLVDIPVGSELPDRGLRFIPGGTDFNVVYDYINDNYANDPAVSGIIIITDSDMLWNANSFSDWAAHNPQDAANVERRLQGKCLYIDCNPAPYAKQAEYDDAVIPGSEVVLEGEASPYDYSTHNLFEGKALTSEEKMDRWHNGSRKENIKACSDEKLKEYRKICRAKGYAEEVKQINAELRARKSVSESFVFEAKSDNSGLRNSVLYGFLLRKVAPIVAATVTEAGFAAKVHDSSAAKDKVADVKVDIKGRGINGVNKLNINYYNPGEPVMGVSNSKFASGSVKTDPTFGLAFVSEEKVYIIPKPVLQRNWGRLMSTDRSIQMVKDALGMRSEITICDASRMMALAENEGYVYTMSATNAAKYRTELNKYLGVDDANAPVTESLSEAEDPFAVEPVPGEAGKYLAKKILQNTLYAIEDPQKRQSCLNNYKKVFLSGNNGELKSFVLEIQARIKQGDNNW